MLVWICTATASWPCFMEGVKSQLRGFKLERIEQFKELLRPDDGVAVEATGNTRYFVESIADRPAAVKVLDPRKFKVISESAQKTDKNDARLIAYFLSKDMIPEIRLKSRNYCEVQSLAHTRDKLVKLRTILKNKVNNIELIIAIKICEFSRIGRFKYMIAHEVIIRRIYQVVAINVTLHLCMAREHPEA